jgi:hypothetical protein
MFSSSLAVAAVGPVADHLVAQALAVVAFNTFQIIIYAPEVRIQSR